MGSSTSHQPTDYKHKKNDIANIYEEIKELIALFRKVEDANFQSLINGLEEACQSLFASNKLTHQDIKAAGLSKRLVDIRIEYLKRFNTAQEKLGKYCEIDNVIHKLYQLEGAHLNPLIPDSPKKHIALRILSSIGNIVLLPYHIIKFAFYNGWRKIASMALNPSQILKYSRRGKHRDRTSSSQKHPEDKPYGPIKNVYFYEHTIRRNSKDGVSLSLKHSLYLRKNGDGLTNINKPTIVTFNGNAGTHGKTFGDLKETASTIKCNVLGFNYRNCDFHRDFTTSTSEYDLIQDGITAVEALRTNGVEDKNIMLFGNSLGGGVALGVTEYYAKKGIFFATAIKNSFSSIPSVIDFLRELSDSTFEKGILRFGKFLMRKASFELRSEDRLKSLSSMPQMQSKLFVMNAEQDTLIGKEASLYQAAEAINNDNPAMPIQTRWYNLLGEHNSPLTEMFRTGDEENTTIAASRDLSDFFKQHINKPQRLSQAETVKAEL